MIATLDTSNAKIKSVPLSSLTREFFETLEGGAPEGELSALRAQAVVPWVYRAVDLRANAVADMPFGLYKTNDAPLDEQEARAISALLKSLLYLTEAALCVYGAAYWVKEENRAGLNVTPRWIVPTSITPQYDAARGLIGFERRVASAAISLSLDEVVYFWIPSLTSELGAGVAPAQAALRSANLLNYLDSFASGFFQRGAVKATLLTVQGTAQQAEMERLERWWNRLLAGVKNAWRSVAIRADVKPVVIGSDISEASAPELKNAAREDVATAFGIPQSLLMSNAANYATAVNDVLVFTLWTVLPECRRIQETLNAQLFDALGLRFEFEPKRLEQMQQYELQKAQSVQSLTGGAAILDVDEARALLGYAPKQTETETGDDVAQDLKRWERKTLNRIKQSKSAECAFMSDAIPQSLADAVRAQLAQAANADAVKNIFANAARQGGAGNGDTVDAFFRAHNDQKRQRCDAPILRAPA